MGRPLPPPDLSDTASGAPLSPEASTSMRLTEVEDDWTSESLEPAAITRTSSELLKRPLPKLIGERPVCFVLGPNGVGKSTVARRIAGSEALEVDAEAIRNALLSVARFRAWPHAMDKVPALILDGMDCLYNRFGAVEMLGQLVRQRALAGHRTVLCQGPVDTSLTLLATGVPHHLRATILLRFPVGSGRRRYIKQRCAERGIDFSLAREAVFLEPWSYAAVERLIDGL